MVLAISGLVLFVVLGIAAEVWRRLSSPTPRIRTMTEFEVSMMRIRRATEQVALTIGGAFTPALKRATAAMNDFHRAWMRTSL